MKPASHHTIKHIKRYKKPFICNTIFYKPNNLILYPLSVCMSLSVCVCEGVVVCVCVGVCVCVCVCVCVKINFIQVSSPLSSAPPLRLYVCLTVCVSIWVC